VPPFRSIYPELRVAAITLMAIAGYALLLSSRSWHSGFAFEKYEGFLGLGQWDELAAKSALLKAFPIGTTLDHYEQYFAQTGGRCFTLRQYPNQLTCTYDHWRIPPLPLPSTTWAVIIAYDPSTRASANIKVAAGLEGL
jgi:hypothetical protein